MKKDASFKRKTERNRSFPCWHLVLSKGQVILSSIHDVLYFNRLTDLETPKGHFTINQYPTSMLVYNVYNGGVYSVYSGTQRVGPPRRSFHLLWAGSYLKTIAQSISILAYIPG